MGCIRYLIQPMIDLRLEVPGCIFLLPHVLHGYFLSSKIFKGFSDLSLIDHKRIVLLGTPKL